MPRNDVVANFVGFIPTVFREGDEVDISFSPADCVLLGEDDRRLV